MSSLRRWPATREVPADLTERWQALVTALAQLVGVPVGLVTRRLSDEHIQMLVPAVHPDNPYEAGSVDDLVAGLYCEHVMRERSELLVSDASVDPKWAENPDMKLGMVAYFGYPISWPGGELFGTICALDNKPNEFGPAARALLVSARDVIQQNLSDLLAADDADSGGERAAIDATSRDTGTAGSVDSMLMWDFDVERGLVRFSGRMAEFYGLGPGPAELLPAEWFGYLSADSSFELQWGWTSLLEGMSAELGLTALVGTGPNAGRSVSISARSMCDEAKKVSFVVGTQTDASLRHEGAGRLLTGPFGISATKRLLARAVLSVDRLGDVTFVNTAMAALLGPQRVNPLGAPVEVVLPPDGGFPPLAARIRAAIDTLVPHDEFRWHQRGEASSLHAVVQTLGGAQGIVGASLVLSTEPVPATVLPSARTPSPDPVTGLPRRAQLEQRLDELRADATSNGLAQAVVVVQIDRMRSMIDMDGHDAVDQLLSDAARRLERLVGPTDLVASLSYGEFAIAIRDTGMLDFTSFADDLLLSLRSIPIVGGVRASARVGVATFNNAVIAADMLVQQATVACRAAQDTNISMCIYEPEGGLAAQRRERIEMAAQVRRAIDNGQFQLYCQPIVALNGRNGPAHHEVLVRMIDDAGAVVRAADFVGVAEEFDLVRDIDRWVVERSLRSLARSNGGTTLAVNLSARSLSDVDLWPEVSELFTSLGLPYRRVTFEITETAMIANSENAMAFAQAARVAGCRIALDDFGTGMSSFGYLRLFGVDQIKIDGSFVRQSVMNTVDRALVQSINEVAHRLGATTVAECIEDDATLAQITAMGIDYGQGFGISRPRPMDDLLG